MHVPAVVADQGSVDDRTDAIIGRCPAMQEVYKGIGRVAGQDMTVLITGESGTGKELVARAIYQHSRRAGGPFLAINCAAIPEHLLESELFGHEKGAFTGADRRRIGKFEQCSGGTLFLDEIADMSPLTQSKMLRLLQEQRFERLGGNETIQSDVRLLAATNQNLEQLVGRGLFRQDLYYRLSGYTLRLPPLRERGDDLILLVHHYVRRFNRELGKDVQQVAPEAFELLRQYAWPGNIRELQSVLRQALVKAVGPILLPDFLPASLRNHGPAPLSADDPDSFAALGVFIEERLAAVADARAAPDGRQSAASGQNPGHHTRQLADEDSRAGDNDRTHGQRARGRGRLKLLFLLPCQRSEFMSSSEPQPATPPGKEDLKRAFKAFKKRLKLARLDEESRIGGSPLSSGRKSHIVGIQPPEDYPPAVWEELVKQGKLKRAGGGTYELVEE
jgi:DNA-binding NtrC family response regulator